jgi:hypothetical protein
MAEEEYTNWMKCIKCNEIFILPYDVAVEVIACIIAEKNGFILKCPDLTEYHNC